MSKVKTNAKDVNFVQMSMKEGYGIDWYTIFRIGKTSEFKITIQGDGYTSYTGSEGHVQALLDEAWRIV